MALPQTDCLPEGKETRSTEHLLAAAAPAIQTPPPTPPPHRALFVPELLLAIFARRNNAASLAAASRVCRAWFGPAVHVLWRAPAPTAFRYVSDARSALYGPAVRHLAVYDYSGAGDAAVHHAEDVDHGDCVASAWCFPAVRTLLFGYNVRLVAQRLMHVLERCGPLLTAVDLEADEAELLDCRDNGTVCLLSCITSGNVLNVLASQPGLFKFSANCHVSRSALQLTETTVAAKPFAHLRELSLSLYAADVPYLVSLLGAGERSAAGAATSSPLASLALRILSVTESTTDVSGALASMHGLHNLRQLSLELVQPHALRLVGPQHAGLVALTRQHPLGAAEFRELARSLPTELRVLRLVRVGECPASPDVAAAHWYELAARLPHLRVLRTDVWGGRMAGADLLRALGHGCRQLRELHLARVPVHLADLHGSSALKVLFPQLQELHIDIFTGFEQLSLGQARQRCIGLAAELRRKYAPELRVFCDMNVFASPQLAKLSVTEVISPEAPYPEPDADSADHDDVDVTNVDNDDDDDDDDSDYNPGRSTSAAASTTKRGRLDMPFRGDDLVYDTDESASTSVGGDDVDSGDGMSVYDE